MSISTNYNSVVFTGNGYVNQYSFTFPVFSVGDIVVSVQSPSGTIYDLQLTQDFVVYGLNPSGGMASTGYILLVNNGQAWLTGGNLTINWTITISRIVSSGQPTSLRNQGNFFPMTIENALDYLTMLIQQTPIITDQSNGHTYKLISTNGILSLQQVK